MSSVEWERCDFSFAVCLWEAYEFKCMALKTKGSPKRSANQREQMYCSPEYRDIHYLTKYTYDMVAGIWYFLSKLPPDNKHVLIQGVAAIYQWDVSYMNKFNASY